MDWEIMLVIEDKHSREHADGVVGLRHARMKRHTAVLMSRRDDAWTAELEDISATGVLLTRPEGWHGQPGDLWVLDMLFGNDLNIHLEARVARLSSGRIGMAFARIPEDKQAPLWSLLGGYADTLEPWQDD